jgi:hypothetical protein
VSADARLEVSLRIGQRVRHRDYKGQRVTGVVRGIAVEGDNDALMVDLVLDAPIVIPARADLHEISIYRQHVPAHELSPFDDRDELVETLLEALQPFVERNSSEDTITITVRTADVTRARAAIAKATGSAS